MSTATRGFGSSRREGHDSGEFYSQFDRDHVERGAVGALPDPAGVDACRVVCGDAVDGLRELPGESVGLVVTSPPYFAGKDYETGVRATTWTEYQSLLRRVFAEVWRVLEPGGRVAVNVTNLGRRPLLLLPGIVERMLGDLGFVTEAEIVWRKFPSSGDCSWGSFCSPTGPAVRDVTERVIVVAKGQHGRVGTVAERRLRGLPWEATVSPDEFMAATTDVWDIGPASASKVGHPAPFPAELVERIVDVWSFRGDLVVDPFVGSGTTCVAARRLGRRWFGVDADVEYVAMAEGRVADVVPADDVVVPRVTFKSSAAAVCGFVDAKKGTICGGKVDFKDDAQRRCLLVVGGWRRGRVTDTEVESVVARALVAAGAGWQVTVATPDIRIGRRVEKMVRVVGGVVTVRVVPPPVSDDRGV